MGGAHARCDDLTSLNAHQGQSQKTLSSLNPIAYGAGRQVGPPTAAGKEELEKTSKSSPTKRKT
jgi:hypothetical protein